MCCAAQSVPMTPILNGSDPLTELTRDLDDRLRADAYRQRGLSPWQVGYLLCLMHFYPLRCCPLASDVLSCMRGLECCAWNSCTLCRAAFVSLTATCVSQTTFDAEPSYGEEDVASARYSYEAEQPAFGFTERDSDLGPGYHSRTSSAGACLPVICGSHASFSASTGVLFFNRLERDSA